MTLTDDGAALLRAVMEFPDEDTPRLVFADWVQEAGDDARAEFIRVQVELAKIPPCPRKHIPACKPPRGDVRCDRCEWNIVHHDRLHHCRSRETVLLAKNEKRWRGAGDCDHCGGNGRVLDKKYDGVSWRPSRLFGDCPHCLGTGRGGPLMGTLMDGDVNAKRIWAHRVEFVRGMKRVHCTLAEVCELRGNTYPPRDGDGWHPTDWALDLCRAHPDVCELWVRDREPEEHRSVGQGTVTYSWYCDGFQDDRATIPEPVLDAMTDGEMGLSTRRKAYPTADAARVALARATVAWIRSHL